MIPSPGIISASSGRVTPASFSQLRAWWESSDLTAADGTSGSGANWTARAGSQAFALPILSGQVVAREAGTFPNGVHGQIAPYSSSTPTWDVTTGPGDGITYFYVGKGTTPTSLAFALCNQTPTTPRQFALYNDASELRSAKIDGGGISYGISSTGKLGAPFSWVISYGKSTAGNIVRVTLKWQGGSVTQYSTTDATGFGTPNGINFNYASGGGAAWGQGAVRFGVIGRVLSLSEQSRLCNSNARASGF